MGARGIIRDIIGIYLGYKIIKGYIYRDFTIDIFTLISAIILLIFAIWFILERIGIV